MKQTKLEYNFEWRQKGEYVGRGLWKFANGAPCSNCKVAALFERGGNGKAGTGVRICDFCLRKEKKG